MPPPPLWEGIEAAETVSEMSGDTHFAIGSTSFKALPFTLEVRDQIRTYANEGTPNEQAQ